MSCTVPGVLVYVCGISNGGHISYYLAEKSGDRIAALAPVASGLASKQNYLPAAPIPIMVIHGTGDKFIPYKGGKGKRDSYMATEKTIDHLIEVNHASPKAESFTPYPGFKSSPEIDTLYYEGAQGGKDVAFIRVNGGGHTWPDGGGYADKVLGTTSRAMSANSAIWEFFKNHPRNKKTRILGTEESQR